MGRELYQSSPAARKLLDEANQILEMPLTDMMFNGPSQELERTENSQPAIMAMSLACLEAWREMTDTPLPRPAALAGHSLGEYTALAMAGALDWADALKLVRERGKLMQKASDLRAGAMAAIIGLDESIMEEICMETGVEIANINSDEQLVISGDRMSVARSMDLASMRGARKTVPLPVCGAFHSTLMYPAQEGLTEAIQHVKFYAPNAPIIANANATPLTTADGVKTELEHQLCSCVQWRKSVKTMNKAGASQFIEFGPGKVLSGLVKRISRSSAKTINLSDLDAIEKAAGAANAS